MGQNADNKQNKPVQLHYGYVVAGLLTILLVAQLVQPISERAARNGDLDLSGIGPGQTFLLKGEWAFYWNQLIRPLHLGQQQNPTAYMKVPSLWTSLRLPGKRFPAVGDATYKLAIRHPWKDRQVGIKILRIGYAFELYEDSSLIASAGSLSDSSGGFEGRFAPQTVYFTPKSDRTVITVLVSSRIPYGWSGITDNLVIGERETIEAESNASIIANAFNVSGRILFSILFFCIFAVTRSRLAATFSLTALVMTMRNSLTRDMVFLRVFPFISINVLIRLIVISSFLTVPFLLLTFESYLRENKVADGIKCKSVSPFPIREARDWVVVIVSALILIFVAYMSLADDSNYLRYFMYYLPIVLLCYVYYSAWFFYDAAMRRVGPAPVGIFVILCYYTAFEILCQLKVIDQEYLNPFYFLGCFKPLVFLANLKIQQGIVSYLNNALLAIYFAYDILRRRFARSAANEKPALADPSLETMPQEKERPVSMSDNEAFLIEARVERIISDPAVIGRPELDLRTLADLVKTQSYLLSFWFNVRKGTSFPVWLNTHRIELVKKLILDNPDRSILEIATEAGYASKSVFNAQFRKIVGKSPSEWRKAAGN